MTAMMDILMLITLSRLRRNRFQEVMFSVTKKRRIHMVGRRKRIEEDAFSKISGYVWTRHKIASRLLMDISCRLTSAIRDVIAVAFACGFLCLRP